jgi:hypothetical protein
MHQADVDRAWDTTTQWISNEVQKPISSAYGAGLSAYEALLHKCQDGFTVDMPKNLPPPAQK